MTQNPSDNVTVLKPNPANATTAEIPQKPWSLVKRHGGRFLTRGDPVSTLEGDTFKNRMVILEFPDEEAVNRWYEDPDYAAAMKFRHEASVGSMLVQEGQQDTENPEPNV
ncbi:hypothetical protein HG531_012068 [Fusarium graminearum]|nr:hypothetical protein HG531_012068 [Fusarium graminearum]